MDYTGAPEQAEKLANMALERMRAEKVTLTPNNYAVWFHYYSGKHAELKKTMDVLIDNGQDFDDERCRELFEKFFTFGTEGMTMNETSLKLQEQLASVMAYIGESRDGVAAYGRTLEEVSGGFEKSDSENGDLHNLLTSVMTATRTIEHQNAELEGKLKESSDEVSRLHEDLEDMRREAMTDPLTGISNRKVFDNTMRRAAMEAMEDGEPLSLLMIDIDHFKRFNDDFGHQVGDQVLRLLANTLTQSIKGQDTAARYGGEEFGVILPNTPLKAAASVAETIRKSVASRKVRNRTTQKDMGQITVSIGVGTLEFGEPIGQLISRADQALYAAKGQGRNRVVDEDEIDPKTVEFET